MVRQIVYLGKEGAERNIWSSMCSRILEEQNSGAVWLRSVVLNGKW